VKIRDLYFRMRVLDQATKRLADTKVMADRVGQTVATVETRVNDRASAPLRKVAAAANTVQTTFSNFQGAAAGANRTLSAAGDAGSKAATGMDRAAQATGRLASGLSTVQARAGQAGSAIDSINSKLDTMERGATKISAAAGAVVGGAIHKAADYKELMGAIENRAATPEVAKALQDWVKEGQGVEYSSGYQRAKAAAQVSVGISGGLVGVTENADLQLEFLEQLEKTLAVQGAAADPNIQTLGDASSMLNSFMSGNIDSLNDLIPGFQMSNEQVAQLREKYRAAMPELKGFTDQQIDLYIGMKEAIKIMKQENEGKEDVIASTIRMIMAFEKLATTLGLNLIPTFERVTGGLNRLAVLAEKYPDASKYAAFAVALAFVGGTAVVVAAQVFGALATLSSLGGVAAAVTAPLKALTAAQWLLNVAMAANPIGIVIVGVAALLGYLGYLAYRSGLLAKAWEYLKSLDLGGTLAAGVDWATERWSDFLDLVDGVSSKLKGMSAGELLKGAISMAIKVSPGGMVAAVLTQKIPGLLTWIWDSIATLTDRLKDWLEGLIPDWLGQVVEWLQGAWGYLKDLYGTFRGWYDRLKMILFGGYNEQGQFEAGIATKIGDRIVEALRGAPVIGGHVTQMVAEGEVAQAKAEGKTESETMRELTGIARFRGKSHAGEVYVIEYEAKDLYAESMQEQYGKTTLSWPEFQQIEQKNKPYFVERLISIDVEAAKTLGYDVEKAKAIEKAFAGSEAEPPLPTVEEPSAMTEGVPGTATPPPEIAGDVGPTGIVPAAPQSSGSEIASFAGSGTAPADVVMLLPEDVGLPSAEVEGEGEGLIDRVRRYPDRVRRYLGGGSEEVEALQSGGGVETTGGAVVHAGEEYSPAQVVRKTTAAERLADSVLALVGLGEIGGESRAMTRTATPLPGSGGGEAGSETGAEGGPRVVIQLTGPLMHVDRIEREVDINDAVWKLRTMLEDLVRRGEGNYLGGGW